MNQCSRCGSTIAAGSRFCGACGRQVSDPAASTLLVGEEEDSLLVSVRHVLAGEYEIEREIGRGGMAVVFKATEAELHRKVALKVLPPELALSRSLADRFKREARMAASLEHPNIIPVYREGQAGSFLYIAMKYIEGLSLDAIIQSQGPLPVPVVMLVLRSATSALAYAHDRGIVHRDIKGANIMVDRGGRVLVSDFGIARAAEDGSLTSTGTVIGTPYFMSPEQCAARRIGPQTDQYSLGIVAFQMLTGLVPFHADTLPGIMHHHFYTPIPDMTSVRPDAPLPLVEVISRALAKKPEQRFATTDGMLSAVESLAFGEKDRREGEQMLRDLAHGLPITAVSAGALPSLPYVVRLTPPNAPTVSPARSRRAFVPASLAAAAIIAVAGLWSWRAGADAPHASTDPKAAATAPAGASDSRERVSLSAGGSASIRERVPERGRATAPADSAAAGEKQLVLQDPATRRPYRPANAGSGKVRVRAYPSDAEIAIDEKLMGTGVVLDSVVPAGTRRLKVFAPGYLTFDSTFVVLPGEMTQLPRITLRTTGGEP